MYKKQQFTPISQIGEHKLIELLCKKFKPTHPETIIGPGDDAAVLKKNTNKNTLVSTDMLVEGIHFDLMYTPLVHLGYKSIVVNISDICAMNGTALQVLVSLAIPNKYSVEMVDQIYEGVSRACLNYNLDLIGGDVTASATGMVISVSILGECRAKQTVTRDGAKHNDLIVVSGNLGASYLGLQILEREKAAFTEGASEQPELDNYKYILERQLKPEARADVIEGLDSAGVLPSSMIDVSDGLSTDLLHLSNMSGTGFKLFEDKLPISKKTRETAKELNVNPTTCALYGGEDYELLFTVPIDCHEKLSSVNNICIIGHVTKDKGKREMITQEGQKINIENTGWDPFKTEQM